MVTREPYAYLPRVLSEPPATPPASAQEHYGLAEEEIDIMILLASLVSNAAIKKHRDCGAPDDDTVKYLKYYRKVAKKIIKEHWE